MSLTFPRSRPAFSTFYVIVHRRNICITYWSRWQSQITAMSNTLSTRQNLFSENCSLLGANVARQWTNILSIISCQMEAVVLIILQIFFTTRGLFAKLGNITRIFPKFSWGIFIHVKRLDQLGASENIWLIIRCPLYIDLHRWWNRKNFAISRKRKKAHACIKRKKQNLS